MNLLNGNGASTGSEAQPHKYTALFAELKDSIRGTALDRKCNPILQLDNLNSLDYKLIIQDYSCLSNRAIQFLASALVYSYGWDHVYKEIEGNIEEEKGKFTDGVPHLIIMRNGYLNELGINTSRIAPMECTKTFLYNMSDIFIDNNPAYVAGAALAFESVAIEEFHILEQIVSNYLATKGRKLGGLTKMYIDGHQKFEIEHSQNLEKAIAQHLDEEHVIYLREGYEAVRYEMDVWWRSMANEIERNKNG